MVAWIAGIGIQIPRVSKTVNKNIRLEVSEIWSMRSVMFLKATDKRSMRFAKTVAGELGTGLWL